MRSRRLLAAADKSSWLHSYARRARNENALWPNLSQRGGFGATASLSLACGEYPRLLRGPLWPMAVRCHRHPAREEVPVIKPDEGSTRFSGPSHGSVEQIRLLRRDQLQHNEAARLRGSGMRGLRPGPGLPWLPHTALRGATFSLLHIVIRGPWETSCCSKSALEWSLDPAELTCSECPRSAA